MMMMMMMRANQTRLQVLAGVFHLENFTVADLCLRTALTRDMVYRILRSLQEEGVLTTSRSDSQGDGPVARHRPPRRYHIVDGNMRQAVINELRSFLPPDVEEPIPNRNLTNAQEILTGLSDELLSPSLQPFSDSDLQNWEERLSATFQELEAVLQRAVWESEADLSETGMDDHPILRAQRLSQRLRDQFQQYLSTEQKRRAARRARKEWGKILIDVANLLVLDKPTPMPIGAGRSFSFSSSNFFPLVDNVVEQALARHREVARECDEDMLSLLSSLKLELSAAQSHEDLLGSLAKQTIEYGEAVKEPLSIVRKMAELQSNDYRLHFNEANLEFLAHQYTRAFASWSKYLDTRGAAKTGPAPLMARVLEEHWSSDAYRVVVRSLTTRFHAVAVSAFSENPFDPNEGYLIEPKLYNPLHEDLATQNILIPVSEPLARSRGLYVLTTQADQLILPGLPALVCANLLTFGIERKKAWEVAMQLKTGERILKVDFLDDVDTPSRREAEILLKSTLLAEVLTGV